MIIIKNAGQIEKLRRAGAIVYEALEAVAKAIEPGVSTRRLDDIAEQVIRSRGGIPSCKGYRMGGRGPAYPGTICASVDDEVVHGIPGARRLREGQIISIDIVASLDGYHGDSARTFAVGEVSPEAKRLIEETERCFWLGVKQAVAGNRVHDISKAVQTHAEQCGYGVVRALCGHGVGQDMHEEPEVPNFISPARGPRLQPGMVITIEPMIAQGTWQVSQDSDGWTVRTDDGKLCSHYEHTMVITPDGLPDLLTLPDGGAWKEAFA